MQPPVDHVFVRTTESKAAAAVRIGAGLGQQKRAELGGLLRVCFARVEPWLQAGEDAGGGASGRAERDGSWDAGAGGGGARRRAAPAGSPGRRGPMPGPR